MPASIDYNKPITREHISLEVYNNKFRLCEEYLSGNLGLLKQLLEDPTTFAYLFFKDDHGRRFKPYTYQDIILNDKHRYIYFRSANQLGKTTTFKIKAGRNILIDHGHAHNEAIISKSLNQSTFQMKELKVILNNMNGVDWKEEESDSDSLSIIALSIRDDSKPLGMKVKYVNRLICAPCTESALGYPLHELNLDEFEYWENDIKYFYNQIAKPRTFHTQGRTFIMTNPNGADSFGAELEDMRDLDGNRLFHLYVFDYMDHPEHTETGLRHEMLGMSRQQAESTLLALRSISSRNFFTQEEINKSYDKDLTDIKMVGKQPFFFLDVGSKHDQSVLKGGFVEPDVKEEKFNHVYIPIIHVYPVGYPMARVIGVPVEVEDGWHYEKSVKEHIDEWSKNGINPVFGVDVTGNSGISPLCRVAGLNPVDVIFSGPAKSGMYQRFKYFMEKGLLHRPHCKEWEYQASHMEVRKSQRGYLMIHHENEDDLDDCMDATAGLIFLADDPNSIDPELKII